MGTHPIFESDFDCLTDMKLFLLFATSTLAVRSRVNYDVALKIRDELDDIRMITSNIYNFPPQPKISPKTDAEVIYDDIMRMIYNDLEKADDMGFLYRK